jgi:hypothetical protein
MQLAKFDAAVSVYYQLVMPCSLQQPMVLATPLPIGNLMQFAVQPSSIGDGLHL